MTKKTEMLAVAADVFLMFIIWGAFWFLIYDDLFSVLRGAFFGAGALALFNCLIATIGEVQRMKNERDNNP